MSSKITTDLLADDPISIDADYRFDVDDREYIDAQIRGTQQHLVDLLIRGRHASWFDLASSSAAVAVGDTCCLNSTSDGTVTKSTSAKLTSAGAVTGVVIYAASPGGKVLLAFGGVVPPSITGLAATSGFARVDATTGRLERVATPGATDYIVGAIDSAGFLAVGIAPFGAYGAATTPTAPVAIAALEIDWTESQVFHKTLAAGANTFTFANVTLGPPVISVRLTGAASTVTWPTVKWAGGTPPVQTASGTDVYTFIYDGTDIYGSVIQDMS